MGTLKAIVTGALNSLEHGFFLLWGKLSPIIPSLVVALVVLVIGSWLATFIGEKIGQLSKKAKIDDALDKIIISPISKLSGTKINISGLIGGTVKWILLATVLIAVLDIAKLSRVVDFFSRALYYLPNIFVAALIMIVGTLLADFTSGVVRLATKHDYLIDGSRLAVIVLALIAALNHVITPLSYSLNQFIAQLGLSKLQADVLIIGVIVILLLGCKNAVVKIVESLFK